jgi:polyphosphate kinase 2 (PPK2 family)
VPGKGDIAIFNRSHYTRVHKLVDRPNWLVRFVERLEDPARNWKTSESDYSERACWDDYVATFEDALMATSTKDSPWFVMLANHKWFRSLAASQIIADTMEGPAHVLSEGDR